MKQALFIAILVLSLSHISHGFCPELAAIGCSCPESDVKLECVGFLDFEDLDFTLLDPGSPLRDRMEELVLEPLGIQEILDGMLDLGPLRMIEDGRVILRNIGGFQFNANSFEDLTEADKLSLIIENSVIKTNDICSIRLLEADDVGLFSEFTTLMFGENLIYTDEFCPLIFYRAKITYIEATSMTNNNYLRFELVDDDEDVEFDLGVNVINYRITDSTNLVINNRMLSKLVFNGLQDLTLSRVALQQIETEAFRHTKKLINLNLQVTNFEQFIRGSLDHQWMK